MKRLAELQELAAPVALVVAAALFGAVLSVSTQTYFIDSLVNVSIVVALYVFVGSSGVLSFGHISFVAVGAWTAGVLSVPAVEKSAIMPGLAHFLQQRTVGNIPSLALAAVVGGVCAIVVALPLMRLSGLAAGIATFGVLEITHNVLQYESRIGPGLNTFSSVPETTGLTQASDRRGARDRRRLRLCAEPLRPSPPCHARGRCGSPRGRDLDLPPAHGRLRALRERSPVSQAASTSTFCRSRPEGCTSI